MAMIDLEHGGVLSPLGQPLGGQGSFLSFPEVIDPSQRRRSTPPPIDDGDQAGNPDVDDWVPSFDIGTMPMNQSSTLNSVILEKFYTRNTRQMRIATLTIISAMTQFGMQIRIKNLVRLIRPARKIIKSWRNWRERKRRRIMEIVNYWCGTLPAHPCGSLAHTSALALVSDRP